MIVTQETWDLYRKLVVQPCTHVVTETDDGKITVYWPKPIKADRKVICNRPDVVVIDREENTWRIVDFLIPVDYYVKEKEGEKIGKYMD